MSTFKMTFKPRACLALVGMLAASLCGRLTAEPLREGIVFDLRGRAAALKRLEALPYVENDYTRRFKFNSFENLKLKELREHDHLDEAIAPGKDELDQQVRLMDWAHRQFKKFGQRPPAPKALWKP